MGILSPTIHAIKDEYLLKIHVYDVTATWRFDDGEPVQLYNPAIFAETTRSERWVHVINEVRRIVGELDVDLDLKNPDVIESTLQTLFSTDVRVLIKQDEDRPEFTVRLYHKEGMVWENGSTSFQNWADIISRSSSSTTYNILSIRLTPKRYQHED